MIKSFNEEYADTKSKALSLIKNNDFSFIFITDMHIDYADVKPTIIKTCETAVKLSKEVPIDCIILGGDIIHGISEKEASLNLFNEYVDVLSKADVPVFCAHGNHDDNAYHSEETPWRFDPSKVLLKHVIPSEVFTEYMIKPLSKNMTVHDKINPLSAYYYVDFPSKKTRLIFIDAYDYPIIENGSYCKYTSENWNKLSDTQLNWLVNDALNVNKDDYKYYLISHCATDRKIGLSFNNREEILSIIKAFNNRLLYKNERLFIEKDFSKNKISMPLSFFGHTHVDSYSFFDDEKILLLGTGNAKIGEYFNPEHYQSDYTLSPKREKGTASEYLFDIYNINSSGKLNKIRFGAGEDYILDYKKYL